MDEEEFREESLIEYQTLCPECNEILSLDGIWEEGELYSCEGCGKFWKYSDKRQKWIDAVKEEVIALFKENKVREGFKLFALGEILKKKRMDKKRVR